ncbi:MAG TPA: nucleoside deaminase [Bacteroidales bacterium]|nr:nucleoside deaminase [Bacteroidales bacterium]
MFKNRFNLVVFLLLLFFTLAVIFQTQIHDILGSKELDENLRHELAMLGGEALQTRDVPVGALLVFEGEIIGRGFNTVRRDSNVAGHAEINALNDAVRKMGIDRFNQLNRKDLVLYTTFEPCEMCKGTLNHYNIRKIRYIKSKSLGHWLKVGVKEFGYELNKRHTGDEQLQDSLFLLHPDYPGHKR